MIYLNNANPISNIDIERIGSPNKPKQMMPPNSDSRHKIDDDEEEDHIITGSQIIESNIANHIIQNMDNDEVRKPNSMSKYFKYATANNDEGESSGRN
jgi:hypothetical protein